MKAIYFTINNANTNVNTNTNTNSNDMWMKNIYSIMTMIIILSFDSILIVITSLCHKQNFALTNITLMY